MIRILIKKIKWICRCECGTIVSVDGSNLKNNHTISCGCIKSKGELKLREILNKLNIPYFTQYNFKDLPKRYFDFYIPSLNLCIEYDGKQHYDYTDTWHQTIEEFNKAKRRDEEKNDFCKKYKILLIRIPYYDYDQLNKEYLFNALDKLNKEELINDEN